MVEQALDGADGRVDGRRFLVAPDGEEEEADQLEAVVQHGVDAILLVALVGADVVESLDLLDQRIVEFHHILALDVRAPVLLENAEVVAEVEKSVQDRLFVRVERQPVRRRVRHVARADVVVFGGGVEADAQR